VSAIDVQLAALEIPEGSLLVASTDRWITREQAEMVLRDIGRALDKAGKRNRVVILSDGFTFESLNDEQLAHIGLMRISTNER
jgi:hypothetical protein